MADLENHNSKRASFRLTKK